MAVSYRAGHPEPLFQPAIAAETVVGKEKTSNQPDGGEHDGPERNRQEQGGNRRKQDHSGKGADGGFEEPRAVMTFSTAMWAFLRCRTHGFATDGAQRDGVGFGFSL